MSPVAFAIVFIIFVLIVIAAYVLLLRQASGYEIQLEALRHRVWRVTTRAELAEARLREMAGGDDWEQEEFWAIAAELSSDEGGMS